MPSNNASTWTAAREIQLISLWEQDDLSATTIARMMGGLSRNAVLGKVFRLRLAKRTCRNHHFYIPEADRTPPKRPVNRSVFPTREQKPRLHIPNPNFKPALTAVTSALTGAVISVKRRPRVPEMSKPELRAMLTQAMVNTGGVLR